MTTSFIWARLWNALRLIATIAIVAAIVAQAALTIGNAADAGRDVLTTTVNFFSYFTVLSNMGASVVLCCAALWFFTRALSTEASGDTEPRWLALALVSVSTYMIVTGIVYNVLLRGVLLPGGSTVPWSNEILHVFAPLFLLADVLFAPYRRQLRWRAVAEIFAFPLVWVAYTLVRGPWVTDPVSGNAWWYPYPFLDPHSATTGGYAGVVAYVIGISIAICSIAIFVVSIGRRRGRTTPASHPSAHGRHIR